MRDRPQVGNVPIARRGQATRQVGRTATHRGRMPRLVKSWLPPLRVMWNEQREDPRARASSRCWLLYSEGGTLPEARNDSRMSALRAS